MTTSRAESPPASCKTYGADVVAEQLGCSEWWVKEQARRRRIPYTWLGGSYRFTADQIGQIIALFAFSPSPGTRLTVVPGADRKPTRKPEPLPGSARLIARPPRRIRSASNATAA